MTLLLTFASIYAFCVAYDLWAEYMGQKDWEQYRKDYFERYGKKLKRKP